MAKTETTHLSVRALADGFRRAGRVWPADETVVPLADFDVGQIAALEAEPLLVVKRVAPEDKAAK